MKDYGIDKLRNICLMAHGGGGKTTLAEAMLYNTGALDRLGKVLDGTTTSDYDTEEIKRKFSINTALLPCEYKEHKINVIDAPGYFDFVGEVKQGIRVCEGTVILLTAKSGMEVGTEKSWDYAKEQGIPVMFFVSKTDEENANFTAAVEQLKNKYGRGVVAFQLPIMENGKFTGYVDVLSKKAYKFDGKKQVESDIPAELKSAADEIEEQLKEEIAETDEKLMEKFFSGERFSPEEIQKGIKKGMKDNSIVPVFCGSAIENKGVEPLMDAIIQYMPSPDNVSSFKAKKAGTEEEIDIEVKMDADPALLVFKTIADPFVGRISIFKVMTGTVKNDLVLYNSRDEKTEKITQLFSLIGKKHVNVDKVIAGDIGAVAKLSHTVTNDTLCSQSHPVEIKKIVFPEPSLSLAVEPKDKGDEDKIGTGLHRLLDEDPTFKVEIITETRQTLISGIGEQHLDIIVSKLKSKFGVSVDLKDPKVPYRETIKKKVRVEGKHKKQSGGHGQFGHVWIEFEPGESEGITFEEKVFGGAVPRQYFPAVEKGLQECILHGVLAGYPVVNLKATLVDGSYHPVDSSEMAFKIAASLAYKKGLAEAGPVLLEPIAHVEVYIPEHYMGDIIGDLNKRRGRIMGMNPQEGGIQQVAAEVPQAEMFKYAIDLRSITQGRGYFKLWFARYEEAPMNISEKVIEEAKKHMEAE